MKRIAFALALTLVLSTQAFADPPLERYIVHTDGTPAVNDAVRRGAEGHGGVVLKEFAAGSGVVVLIPSHARGPMAGIEGVAGVEPDVLLHAVKPPDGRGKPPKDPPPQPDQALPWGIDRIDADLVSVDASGVNIAIIDTGIDADHEDLSVAGGVNFVGGKGRRRKVDPSKWGDDHGHGTHVAGTAAALDNGIGVVGAAPGASMWAVKVLNSNGSGYLSAIIDGIIWATDNGMDIVNMSLGIEKGVLDQFPLDRQALQDAVIYAYDSGVVVVAAAGNEGPGEDTVIYPARFSSVIAVAATDSSDARAWFSSTGDAVELAAPGVGTLSTWNDGLYNTIQGTSMASPHVAGTAALVIAAGAAETNVEVRSLLVATADSIGDPADFGFGLVDAEQAATGIETP